MFQGWKGVVIVLACLAVLGALVALKVPEGTTGAIAIVTTLVAWITRSPASPPSPPTGTALGLLIALAAGLSVATPACATLAAQKAEAETGYLGEQLRCVDKSATRAEADVCRRDVRTRWGIAETQASKDGGR